MTSMNADCFVDTNVLLYANSADRSEAEKARKARGILAREDFGLSAQVVQEFFVNATQKIAHPLSDAEAPERACCTAKISRTTSSMARCGW
jgi:predicted nucleic acid-binding protein